MFFVTWHPDSPPITRRSDKFYSSAQYGLSGAADLLKLSKLTNRKPATIRLRVTRGANGTRTRNPLLAKQVRYQLRHSPVGDLQSSAVSVTDVHRSALSERSTRTCRTTMPTATTDPTATQHVTHFFMMSSAQTRLRMVGLGGLEPPTSVLSGLRSNLLSYRPNRHPFGHSDIVHSTGPSGKIERW